MIILSPKIPPLHKAAVMGYVDEVNSLITNGVCVNTLDESGNEALHFAAVCSQIAVAHVLIGAGANAHTRNCSGQTPLDVAIDNYGKDNDIARFLRAAMEKQGG